MAGVCSRRQAEKKILSNQVMLNGTILRDVGQSINPQVDRVTVNGIDLMLRKQEANAPSPIKVWLAHKLKGELVTTEDPQGRSTIFDRFRQMGLKQHLMPVGRLDYNTEGLLILTNDGEYARQLEHPKSCVQRTYRAFVRGNVLRSKIEELGRGAIVKGVKYRPIQVSVHSTDKKDSWLQVKVREGKNREVRNALAHVRLIVKRLIRVQFGPYRLADLPIGSVLEVTPKLLENQKNSARKSV
ncbi:unnamed protein product [Albugo candida]|uniref:Pseudouridine synthase RsuA/RluA-like domain-containing protein n=1 Tax=Albugo candida TaxID=65357 RepID=A0A024G425_9STRA|nr:unnamed protein product [Albugo candida]|eukprot:CCI41386.1 unnamed protein product [Albugo candida]